MISNRGRALPRRPRARACRYGDERRRWGRRASWRWRSSSGSRRCPRPGATHVLSSSCTRTCRGSFAPTSSPSFPSCSARTTSSSP
uniref:Uncharacterized protein n=1 Tax=Arundo donax TaxID=35708 RepID=A0A0A9A0M2_ARUDO